MGTRVLTPVVTAFDEERNIDIEANKNIYDHLIDGGVDGIVILGSTGEFFNISLDKQKELIDLAVEYIGNRTKLYVGTSCMSVEDTIMMSNYAYNAGADAVMIISPYYFSLSDESIESYYNQVAANTKAKIYLYNFPDRTGYDLSPELTLRLIRNNSNIVGYKDTVMVMGHTRALINTVLKEFPDFDILSGFGENFIHNILCGGGGTISGLSNLAPELFSEWKSSIDNKDIDTIAKCQKRVDVLMKLFNVATPFVPIIKKAMILRGVEMQDYCTKPLLQANEEQTKQIVEIMKEAKLL